MSEPETRPQPDAVAMTFGRRIGIAVALFLAARVVSHTLQLVSAAVLAYRLASSFESAAQIALNFGVACAVIGGVLLVLLHAQRCVLAGKPHWLASMQEPRLIIALIALLLLSRIAPHIAWDSSLYPDIAFVFGSAFGVVLLGFRYAVAVAACYIWIWWCNSPPRAERLILVAALAWVGFEFLLELLDMVAPTLNVLVSRTHEEGWTFQLPGSDAYATVTATSWIWRVSAEQILPSLRSWFWNIALSTPISAAVAAVLFRVLDRQPARAPAP